MGHTNGQVKYEKKYEVLSNFNNNEKYSILKIRYNFLLSLGKD